MEPAAPGSQDVRTAADLPPRPRLKLGLAARLAIGLALVAVLFLVANRVSQQATWLAATQVARVEFEYEPFASVAQSLAAAIGAHERAVLAQADAAAAGGDPRASAGGAEAVARTREALLATVEDHRALTERAPADVTRELPPAALAARVGTLLDQGTLLVQLSERRRTELQAYWRQFDSLDSRVARVGGGKLAVGDHMVVRRSTTEVAAALGAVRERFSAYLAAPDARHEAAVAAAEAAFRGAIARHAAALASAREPGWVTRLQGDFEANVTQRENVIRAERRYARERLRFTGLAARLLALVDTGIAAPARRAMADAARRVGDAAQGNDRTLMGVSLAALILILLVAALTVWSVARPVRRLAAATQRLAAGQLDTRVPGGGAPELDALASDFNRMAAGLDAAQREVQAYQAQLEARVDERTRQLQHLAHHDPLTALPNRRHLFAHLGEAIAEANARGEHVGLLLLDLDNFKVINDSLGHEFGDVVLKAVGERLRGAVAGRGFTARLGGDEFTVVYPHAVAVDGVESLAEAIVAEFRRPLLAGGRELLVGVSVGASVAPDHAPDAESLLRAADSALFRAKELGRNRAAVYSPELYEAAATRFRTEQGLRRAIDSGEFELLYQPQVLLHSLQVDAVEALLRWRRPDGGHHEPVGFLQVAEQSGLIVPIGDWVLATAAAAAHEWQRDAWPAARVAINVSPQQFLDGGFVARLERLFVDTGLPPRCLEIELTESVVQTGPQTLAALAALHALGVSVALDDFGIGYSSMTSLEKLPLSRVKLDRSLIADVDRHPRSAAIARSTIRLCHDLGLEVTAEGVERRTQVEWLLDCGPVAVQGYWFAKPLAQDAVVPFVRSVTQRAGDLGRHGEERSVTVIPVRPRRRPAARG